MENLKIFLISYLEDKYKISETVKRLAENLLDCLEKGSICLKIDDEVEIEELKKSEAVGLNENLIKPLIFYNDNLYIQRYFIYETRILAKIKELLSNEKIHIITGGPGTGKTTSLANILKNKLAQKILLAAPTGKAALRMKESLAKQDIKLEAKTLHRLLGYIHLSVNFKHNKENLLDADIIAIDECSMIDLQVMAKLLDAVPNNCDLYLLGDKNQLASVEAGSVFADICRMFKEQFKNNENIYKELTINYRAKEAQGIVSFSKEILESSKETSLKGFDFENIYYSNNFSIGILLPEYEGLFKAENKESALEFLKTFQILCALKKGKSGTEYINRKLLLSAKNAKFIPIIITKNSYEQNLFNGDVGVKDKENAYFFDGTKIKTFSLLTLPEHDTAFAITIHKSQGSEYKRIAIVYPNTEQSEEQTILTKELLYTAVTRAKNECIIFGNKNLILSSCKREIFRASGIK